MSTNASHETTDTQEPYDASKIKVLKGLEAVRKRPGMYIGDTDDGTGLHHMVFEVVDNAVDEALAGYCSKITILLHKDGSVSIQDNGRGIPVDMHSEEGRSAAEVIMTVLHAGGKFDDNTYKVSGGLHGVGVSVVNALSEKLILVIFRNGQRYEQTYLHGEPIGPLSVVGLSEEQGTQIRFYPNRQIFIQNNSFNYDTLLKRFRELAFLNPGIAIYLKDEQKTSTETHLSYKGGLAEFVAYLNQEKPWTAEKMFTASGTQQNIQVDVALNWQQSFSKETILCFTNTIPQTDGGTHLVGFRTALTRVLNQYVEKEGLNKKFKVEMTGEDFREGLIAVLAIQLPDPKFSSQTKEKLVSSEVRSVVEHIVSKKLESFLLENPSVAQAITLKAIRAGQAREAAAKARKIARKTPLNSIADLPGKLHDCQEKDPTVSELFLVEGKSAGGTVKQARNRRFQAILPLRGKILNIERISFDKMLSSEEIATLIAALGCGVGNEYSRDRLRYHRIIIMTDADVDGSHIRTLLLTFFYRQFPELIDQGYLYIAHPPLYKLKKAKQEIYLQDDEALEAWLADNILEGVALFEKGNSQPILAGQDLAALVESYRKVKLRLKAWEKEYPSACLRALLELPPLIMDDALTDVRTMEAYCKQWQTVLENKVTQQGNEYRVECYSPTIDENHMTSLYLPKIIELRYSINTYYHFKKSFFESDDYQKLTQLSEHLLNIMPKEMLVQQKEFQKSIANFHEFYDWLMQEASQGYTIQRYKGLGEMNWEELLPVISPDTRQLSQVNVDDARESDRIVTILMGHIVDSRRQFIEQNALDVMDIDV